MKFDVIIGNPPYQKSHGGFGKNVSPIYQKFVRQAKRLNPRFLSLIIPSRWFGGGWGMNEFRSEMLNDKRIRKIVDFENALEVFQDVDIAGGVCYFLWERDSRGLCEIINVRNDERFVSVRPLNEFQTLIRHGQAVPIIRKVLAKGEKSMSEQVTSRKPFGLATNVRPMNRGDLVLKWSNGEGPYDRKSVTVGVEMIDKWKVMTSGTLYDHGVNPDEDGKRRVLSKIGILPPGTVCTETYIVAGVYRTEKEALRLAKYMRTRFFRFLVSQLMYSHSITKRSFSFVPILDMDVDWTDDKLYKRYGLTKTEIAFIESMIREMP